MAASPEEWSDHFLSEEAAELFGECEHTESTPADSEVHSSEGRTVSVAMLANDWTRPQNSGLVRWLDLATRDRSTPHFRLHRVTFADFLARGLPESELTAAALTVAVLTEEPCDKADLKAAYSRAKAARMRVVLALPPGKEWCGMVDAGGAWDESEGSSGLVLDMPRERCSVDLEQLTRWVFHTVVSMLGSVMDASLRGVYAKMGLLRPHWCVSGIPANTSGFLDDCLGIGIHMRWGIRECSLSGMTHALFCCEHTLILAKQRDRRVIDERFSLFHDFDEFQVCDLHSTPLEYRSVRDGRVECSVGSGIEFAVCPSSDGSFPVKFASNEAVESSVLRRALEDSMLGLNRDLTLQCQVHSALSAAEFGLCRDVAAFRENRVVSVTDAWLNCVKSVVFRTVHSDLCFLPELLSEADECCDWQCSDQHWTDVLDSRVFGRVSDQSRLFRRCLFAAGLGANERGLSALDWAVRQGRSSLVSAAVEHEKRQHSQSSMEDRMAEEHARWKAQSGHFVREYLLSETGGKSALRVLTESLVRFVEDRGDFAAVDLVGLVWHSDGDSRVRLRSTLMSRLKSTLDYHTLDEDGTGWLWVKESVMKHPLWLCERGSEERKHCSDIMFAELKEHCDSEASRKGGSAIRSAFQRLVNAERKCWDEVCDYTPSVEQSRLLRQDEVPGGRTPEFTKRQIHQIGLQTSSLLFDAPKQYDSRAFLTGLLIDAHLVQPLFAALMSEALSGLGRLHIAPVKQASRVLPKSEEYASEKQKKHCHWPYSACVIDLVRCSLTVDSLGELLTALRAFEQFLSSHSDQLSLVRCKNGFSGYAGKSQLPSHYGDVKMNVCCTDASERRPRAIVGEVQFLLQCVLDSKKQGHRLYQVSRSWPLFSGAARRVSEEWSLQRRLLLTVGDSERMARLLAFFPFQLRMHHFSVLFRSQWTSEHLRGSLASAIVSQSGSLSAHSVTAAMLSAIQDSPAQSTLPVGVAALICAVAQRAGSVRDSVSALRRLLSEFAGQRSLIRALVGLDDSLKAEVDFDPKLHADAQRQRFPDLTAAQLARVFAGWKCTDDVLCSVPLMELHSGILRGERSSEDPSFAAAMALLFELNPPDFARATGYCWKHYWHKRLPEYMFRVLRQNRESCPGLTDLFIRKKWLSKSELVRRVH